MRIECIYLQTCQRLLDEGYHYFVPKYQNGQITDNNVVILEPVKQAEKEKVLPIKDVMHLPEDSNNRYMIMLMS